MSKGEVGILNVGAGDTKITFDPAKPREREIAKRTVTDMLQRGYAILVQVGEKDGRPLYMRAESFDPATCEYLVVGAPDEVGGAGMDGAPPIVGPHERAPRKRGRKARVPAESVRAVAVARSAGG